MTEWDRWRDLYLGWSTTTVHQRRVQRARDLACEALASGLEARIGWSAGKDSTALAYLIRVELGADVGAFSVKDDLDYPGEEEYVRALASAWELRLAVVHPPVSLMDWLTEWAAAGGDVTEDLHSHAAELSRLYFYRLLDLYREQESYDMALLGLRQKESWGRRMATARFGPVRCRASDGLTVACPLSYWSARDVYAYLVSHGIEPHACYTRLAPGESPEGIRKSWWLSGKSTRYGGAMRIRRLWPELWELAKERFPEIVAMT